MSFGSRASALEVKVTPEVSKPAQAQTIRVCHVASGDLWAGAEAQLASLLRALASHGALRVYVILLNEGRLAQEARGSGAEVKVIPESTHSFFEILREAARFVRANDIHILHSHRYKENFLAALLARGCRVPFLVRTEHGAPEPFKGLAHLKQGILLGIDKLLAKWTADRIVSVSGELRTRVATYVNPRRIAVIPNGLDPTQVFSRLSPRQAKRRLNLPEDCLLLGYAGRLVPVKRLDILLEAARLVGKRIPELRVVMAGDGGERRRLETLARSMGIQDRVLFLGHRTDIYDVLRALDLFVLCSDHEGLPMVLLEALHLGVPVAARRVGGIPEVIEDGTSGLLVDSADPHALADACWRLLEDVRLRRRLAQGGKLRVAERYSAERTALDVSGLYHSIAQVRPPAPTCF